MEDLCEDNSNQQAFRQPGATACGGSSPETSTGWMVAGRKTGMQQKTMAIAKPHQAPPSYTLRASSDFTYFVCKPSLNHRFLGSHPQVTTLSSRR
ncbi:hypothetical protein PGT21_034309 [Puccinia graminis f. sp. tritici]|uniref:Uncharacterized protein n=1 Tax=Puccinia graminis f. sp. tritici TaxID=56615 RepID=A0A5B0NTK5_PUCGR|nr:hypothetical protein PGT21_025762 [Puccinia graminis f. sp. tritici]KAA1092243.1 hypothetical protein PGTUg99_004779 [Puccinia graminis f. sp. tritici]KAA1119803.1 hypothetical protein PGT21_034309 [Puccinia graminis f. sp. tritici]